MRCLFAILRPRTIHEVPSSCVMYFNNTTGHEEKTSFSLARALLILSQDTVGSSYILLYNNEGR